MGIALNSTIADNVRIVHTYGLPDVYIVRINYNREVTKQVTELIKTKITVDVIDDVYLERNDSGEISSTRTRPWMSAGIVNALSHLDDDTLIGAAQLEILKAAQAAIAEQAPEQTMRGFDLAE